MRTRKKWKIFFSEEKVNPELEKVGLRVLRGYQFTLLMMNRMLKLRIDVCSRVLQSQSFYELL